MLFKIIEIESWLKKNNIKKYIIDENLTIHVRQSVCLSEKKLKEIPYKFGEISGDFLINFNQLTSLKNCPDVVFGVFNCSYNNITSLKYGPEKVFGNYLCQNNKLHDLEYIASFIDGELNCNSNDLINIKHINSNSKITSINCSNNKISSLKGCPKSLNNLFCENNKISNFNYFPSKIKSTLLMYNNSIQEKEIINFEIECPLILSDFKFDINQYKETLLKSKNEINILKEKLNKQENKISRKL